MGRIGKIIAMEHWVVEPDMMTVVERLAAGMPLSAVVGKAEIMDSVHPGGLGVTYGANPVAHAVIDIFEEEVLLNTSEKPGARLAERFAQWQEKMDIVNEVRGKGAMAGLTLVKKDGGPAAEEPGKVVAYCR